MSFEKEMNTALKKFRQRDVPTFSAEVVSVDKENGTCVVNDGDMDHPDVRLSAVIDGRNDAFYLFPNTGSSVLVAPINEDLKTLYVEQYSEVEELNYKVGATAFKVDQNGFAIAKGSENLRTILGDLIDELNKVNAEAQKIAAKAGAADSVPKLVASYTKTELIAGRLKEVLADNN